MSRDAKRTLLARLQKNIARAVVRPFRNKAEKTFREEDLLDLEEFTGLKRDSILPYLRREPGRRISNEHAWLRPSTQEEYGWFYRGSRTYLFASDEAWDRAVEHAGPGKRCLDFGGGGGRNSMGMARKGAKVHYVDIGVMNASFVAFRSKKHKLDITVIDPMVEEMGRWRVDTADAARRVGGFDLIVCDNVLEHVPEYHAVVGKLAQALAPGGRLLECTPFKREKPLLFGRTTLWDIHLPPTMPMAEAAAKAGLKNVGEGLWERPKA
jgi:2-polyprenyl-3-methyl-5-hydroxy-6-metoxy-1,4-benzoquinol methylase